MTDRGVVLALAALLAVAGCAGAGGPTAAELTVTPAPVPTDAPPTPDERLAPGLTTAGVVDPLALAAAHAAVLRSATYEVSIEEVVVRADGSLIERRVVEGRFAGPTRYRVRLERETSRGPDPTSSLYANGARLYERLETTSGTRYYVPREDLEGRPRWPEDPAGRPTQRGELYAALVGSRPAYVGSTVVDGETRHRVVADGAVHASFLAAWEYVDTIESFRFTATVRDDGLVVGYDLRYEATVGGEPWVVTRTARWTGVGEVTVDPPDWYPTARERTGR